VQASAAADYSIVPTFSYFDTKKEAYETIKMASIALNVSNGVGISIDNNAANRQDAGSMSVFLKWFKIGGILLGILVTLYTLFVFWKRRTKAQKPRVREIFVREDLQDVSPRHLILDTQLYQHYMPIDNTQVVHDQAFVEEMGVIGNIKTSALETALKQGNSSDFYKEMNCILETIATEQYRVAPESMNKEQLLLRFKNLAVNETTVQQFIQLWDATQMARYAGITNPERMQTHFDMIENLV
jgi:hypothetical protein